MPKIIENLSENILITAEKLLEQRGFGAFNVRQLSKELHIAPATIYNYYASKDEIIGEVITRRWQSFLSRAASYAENSASVIAALSDISTALRDFMQPLLSYWVKNEEQQREHVIEKKRYIVKTLTEIIGKLLKEHGTAPETAQEIAPVITKVLILSSHDPHINFGEMVHAIQQLV